MGQDVIELNGKRYNAMTGEYLGKSSVIPKHITLQPGQGKVIDGFVRPSHPDHAAKKQAVAEKQPPAHHAAPKPVEHKTAPAPVAKPAHPHAGPRPLKAHTPEHSKTLMRRSVQKPAFSLKPAIKTQAPAEMMAKPHSALMRKPSVASVDPSRLERAAHIGKHQAVRHFRPAGKPAAEHTVAHVPVIAVRAAPQATKHPARQTKKHVDIFEAAIAHATSHQEPMHKPRKQRARQRLVNTLAVVAAFLVIGGFIGYLNMPGIELRVASMQAGFHASMPAYAPTGYALEGGIKRSGGTVSLSFRSGDSGYTITQQASNWNSQTLLDNTLALTEGHQAIQKNGQTIYLYGDGTNAAWVNGGIRYDVTGNAQLSKDDITAIATSL